MTLVLKTHQLLQVLSFLDENLDKLNTRITLKELSDGAIHVWLTDNPSHSVKLDDELPAELKWCDEQDSIGLSEVASFNGQLEFNFTDDSMV